MLIGRCIGWTDRLSFAGTLIGIHLVAAILLMLGFQSRWMMLLCLVMSWSLEVRNPLLQDSGQVLLRMMMFWCLFLPLDRAWSVGRVFRKDSNSRRKRNRQWTIENLATAGLMIQVLSFPLLYSIAFALGWFSLDQWYAV